MTAHRRAALRGEAPQPGRRQAPDRGRRRAGSRPYRLLPLALGVVLLGIGGVVGPGIVTGTLSTGGTDDGDTRLSAVGGSSEDRRQGLVYAGLNAAAADTLCAGTYELDAETCTHGPDPAPRGLAVGTDVAPVTGKAPEPVQPSREPALTPSDAEIVRDEGGTSLSAGAPALVPDAAPGDADFIIGAHDVACAGDGSTGKRIQVLYLHEYGTPSRFTDYLGSIRTWSAGVDRIFDESAAETGGSRHIRYVTTPNCQVDVAEVQLPAGSLSSFTRSIGALKTLGYNRNDRKYLLFADSHVYCGIATYVADTRTGAGNRNNGGPSYGRVDAGCWSSAIAATETTRMLGAVLRDSPHSTGAGRCTDEYDLLCGPDRSGQKVREVCPESHELRLDCNHDDYFSTDPKPGSYLAENWNVALSEFLLRGDGGDDIPDAPNAVVPDPEPSAGASASAPAPAAPSAPAPGPAASANGSTNGGDSSAGNGDGSANGANGGDASDGGGDAAVPPGGDAVAPSGEPSAAPSTPAIPIEEAAAPAVQAVLEVREQESTSVRLMWSEAAPDAKYQVDVDGVTVAETTATRARLIGLRPDTKYEVTIRSAGHPYTAKGVARSAPAARPAANAWFVLSNSLTGGSADLYAARTADGTPITLGDADGDAQEQWQLVPAGADTFALRSRASGKCVVPLGGNPVAGAPLVQGACGSDDGRWKLFATDHGFSLRTDVGGLAAGVGSQRFGWARLLVLQTPDRSRHQSWTAVPG